MNNIIAVIILIIALSACDSGESLRTTNAAESADAVKSNEAKTPTTVAGCRKSISDLTAEYNRQYLEKSYWDAALTIRRCSALLNDQNLKSMLADVEIKSYVADVENAKMQPADRIRIINMLRQDYPDHAVKYDKLNAQLSKLVESGDESNRVQAETMKRQRAPSIGSTAAEVGVGGWGYPRIINKTTTLLGIREQWVYSNGKYLYFDNGVLTAIQE